MLGPQNTSSSRRPASYTETLFWIFTLLPMTTSLATKTFCPSEQPAPIRAPEQTCAQCQLRVPSRQSTRLTSSHQWASRKPSSACKQQISIYNSIYVLDNITEQ